MSAEQDKVVLWRMPAWMEPFRRLIVGVPEGMTVEQLINTQRSLPLDSPLRVARHGVWHQLTLLQRLRDMVSPGK